MGLTDWLRRKKEEAETRRQQQAEQRESRESEMRSARFHRLTELKQRREQAEQDAQLAKEERQEQQAMRAARHEEYITTPEGRSVQSIKRGISGVSKFLGQQAGHALKGTAKLAFKAATTKVPKQAKLRGRGGRKGGVYVNVNTGYQGGSRYPSEDEWVRSQFPRAPRPHEAAPKPLTMFSNGPGHKEKRPRLPTLF